MHYAVAGGCPIGTRAGGICLLEEKTSTFGGPSRYDLAIPGKCLGLLVLRRIRLPLRCSLARYVHSHGVVEVVGGKFVGIGWAGLLAIARMGPSGEIELRGCGVEGDFPGSEWGRAVVGER
jgi:hypothetical protein